MLHFNHLHSRSGLVHAVTTRWFGTIDDFNLADHVGPNASAAVGHRQQLCRNLGLDFSRLTVSQQVHKTNVAPVTDQNAGRGHDGWSTGIPDTDAMVTNVTCTPMMVLSADCPLVLLFDPAARALAVIHASWRCTFGGIIPKTIATLTERYGSRPADLMAGIGPGAGPCCYRVDEPFETTMAVRPELLEHIVRRQNQRYFDLWAAVRSELTRAGVPAEQIESMDQCTICDERFFSFRRQADQAGRFGLIASLL